MNGWISGLMTLLALLGFLAVVAWAYSSRRKADFESAANLPLDDDEEASK
jgi:cytochrome c oxidase cbb3-type subunit IV